MAQSDMLPSQPDDPSLTAFWYRILNERTAEHAEATEARVTQIFDELVKFPPQPSAFVNLASTLLAAACAAAAHVVMQGNRSLPQSAMVSRLVRENPLPLLTAYATYMWDLILNSSASKLHPELRLYYHDQEDAVKYLRNKRGFKKVDEQGQAYASLVFRQYLAGKSDIAKRASEVLEAISRTHNEVDNPWVEILAPLYLPAGFVTPSIGSLPSIKLDTQGKIVRANGISLCMRWWAQYLLEYEIPQFWMLTLVDTESARLSQNVLVDLMDGVAQKLRREGGPNDEDL